MRRSDFVRVLTANRSLFSESARIVQRQSLGLAVVLSLIALRVGIGMHFFREGLNKFRDRKPFSAGFFSNAKGPFAEHLTSRIWDRDGLARLDQAAAVKAWDQFRVQTETHFRFDDQQKKQAADALKRTEAQLSEHLDSYDSEIDEYRKNLVRRDKYRLDQQRMQTPSLRDQVDKIESDIRSQRGKLLTPIDLIWQSFSRELHGIATPEQRRIGLIELKKPGRQPFDSEAIDRFIPWFDASLGVLLIVGFATRPAALVAASFLALVVVSQWPASPASAPTWGQFVEALGLLVVAATGAGQFAGVDGISSRFFRRQAAAASRPFAPKAGSSPRAGASSSGIVSK